MLFQPPCCPLSGCPSATSGNFSYRRRGFFRRKLDGRQVQRFLCHVCSRTFSSQTFRLDYRLLKPALTREVFRFFVAKSTQRQCARLLGVSRHTLAHRLRLLGGHCQAFHKARLDRAGPILSGTFQLDELETFEHERRLKPVTVPVLIHEQSFFVVRAKAAPLPARGTLSERHREKKRQLEARCGRRKNGSSQAVEECLRGLTGRLAKGQAVCIETDRKSTYPGLIRRALGTKVDHGRTSSKEPRCYGSRLFAINHTLAQMRDCLSRLVRRTWATTKKLERLDAHLWVWIAYRNYVRPLTNKARQISSAMAAGIEQKRWKLAELLELKPAYLPR